MVHTDSPDGALHDCEIAFGVYPMQQYLLAMPDGRLQALGIAWDSRRGLNRAANRGFPDDTTLRYDEAAAKEAWQHTLDWLDMYLRG